jgi:hypothetical protein
MTRLKCLECQHAISESDARTMITADGNRVHFCSTDCNLLWLHRKQSQAWLKHDAETRVRRSTHENRRH